MSFKLFSIGFIASILFSLPNIEVKIIPRAIFPGDAFLVEVKSPEHPSGIFDNRKIIFHNVSTNVYYGISFARLDMRPGKYSIFISIGKHLLKQKIRISKKIFPTYRLTLPPEKVFLSPEDELRVKNESKKLSEIFSKHTKRLWHGNFIHPLDNADISLSFGAIRIINEVRKSVHKGIDYKADEGVLIKAINDGKVVFIDELFFGGKTLILDHGDRIYSLYMHLSEFLIKEGEIVKKGDIIGSVGSTGRTTGPHLHLHLKISGFDVNPDSLLSLQIPE